MNLNTRDDDPAVASYSPSMNAIIPEMGLFRQANRK
jgi:hypothetical protein